MQKIISLVFLWMYLISVWCELQQISEDQQKLPDVEKRVFCNAFTGCGSYRSKRSQRVGSSKIFFPVKRSVPESQNLFSNIFDSNYSPSLRERVLQDVEK
ncbi:unnamed protein product [Larinioides sclopetarius]|uniref:Cardioactive peptide n=1 Tax=Larinioides sclopetarius TaxID=280406 RepID=A0AAV2AZZ0_9ARAC